MLILKHKWDKKKVRKLVDYLYTAKTRRDPMTQYMKKELNSEMLYYLLQNPSLFANQYLYQQFVEMYFPDFAGEHPQFIGMLIQMAVANDMRRRQQRRHQRMYEINYQRLRHDTRQIRQDKRITHTMKLNVDLDKILRETTIDLTAQHEQILQRTIDQLNKAIEKEGLIDIPDIKKNPKLQEKLDKLNKQIERENKRLEKNKTNRVLWQKARLLDDKYKPEFKVWDQHLNPKTRHNLTDGQKVKLEEKFIVINDKTGDIDYVDYPGDWTCSASNSANCLCTLSFTNDPIGYVEHKNLVEDYKSKSEKIKQDILIKRIQRQQERTKKQQLNNKKQEESLPNLHKKPIDKLTQRNMEMFKNYHEDDEQIMKQVEKDKKKYPEEFSKKTIFNIIKFQKFFKDDINEHAMIIDYKTGKILATNDGNQGEVVIPFQNVENTGHLISVHNHPEPIEYNKKQGELQSDTDLIRLMERPKEKYSVVTSDNFVSIIKRPKENRGRYRLFVESRSITNDYFSLLKRGTDLYSALDIYEQKMRKLFESEGLNTYILRYKNK